IARQAAAMPKIGNMAARREKAWRWEHWGVIPDRDTQRAIAALLEVPEEHIEQFGWPRWLPVGDAIRTDYPWTAAGCRAGLDDGQYTAQVGAQLCAAAAELGQLAGWVSFDAGLHGAAQRYYVAALHAAHAAGDRPLGANVLSGMSFQATIVGDPRDGVGLAQA